MTWDEMIEELKQDPECCETIEKAGKIANAMVDTTTTTASWPTQQQEPCGSRLPCGVCMLLGRMCPKVEQTFTPQWTINCNDKR